MSDLHNYHQRILLLLPHLVWRQKNRYQKTPGIQQKRIKQPYDVSGSLAADHVSKNQLTCWIPPYGSYKYSGISLMLRYLYTLLLYLMGKKFWHKPNHLPTG